MIRNPSCGASTLVDLELIADEARCDALILVSLLEQAMACKVVSASTDDRQGRCTIGLTDEQSDALFHSAYRVVASCKKVHTTIAEAKP